MNFKMALSEIGFVNNSVCRNPRNNFGVYTLVFRIEEHVIILLITRASEQGLTYTPGCRLNTATNKLNKFDLDVGHEGGMGGLQKPNMDEG